MGSKRYLLGLTLMVPVIWITMLICLDAVAYELIPWSTGAFANGLVQNIVGLLGAGVMVLAWLYLWNMLVRFYFVRNLRMQKQMTLRTNKKRK